MINTPSWISMTNLGSTASKNTTGLDTANLYAGGNLLPAEHLNQFLYWFSNNENTTITGFTSTLLENQNAVTATGQALAPADNFQLAKTIIALSHQVGELVNTEIPLTPAIWTSGSATYLPVIKRWDADHDVTSAQAPDLVTAYRAVQATINVAGTPTSSFTGTVSGSTITFSLTTANNAMLNLLANEATANGYIATQTAGAAAVYTGTAQRCMNIAGTDYAITNVNTVTGVVTVTGSPTTGSQTCILYTYRIAGSTTSVRLPRLSGFVGVTAYDYDGVFVGGWRKMDQTQGHWHDLRAITSAVNGGIGYIGTGNTGSGGVSGYPGCGSPIADGTNGTPRTGKTTQPQTYALYPHTWAGRLLA